MPMVSFQFNSKKLLALLIKNYLILVDLKGIFYFAFTPSLSSLFIIKLNASPIWTIKFDQLDSSNEDVLH